LIIINFTISVLLDTKIGEGEGEDDHMLMWVAFFETNSVETQLL